MNGEKWKRRTRSWAGNVRLGKERHERGVLWKKRVSEKYCNLAEMVSEDVNEDLGMRRLEKI